ncbi:MAG: PTS sugar transporter subunit IIC [Gemmatimonadetes bacterium]|nr:PTS sugar transporter subunit IIC [Gemmatimonadota bacterium]
MSPLEAGAAVAVGTLVGLDLVSVPQMMFSRPIVAGLLGGAVVGQPLAGLAVGALLELFAMETLPVGAVRYPDWGPGSVAAGALAGAEAGGRSPAGLLAVVLVVLGTAWLGGWLMHVMRRANVASVAAWRVALDAGDARAVRRIQLEGLARDAGRAAVLTVLTLAAGQVLAGAFVSGWQAGELIARVAVVAATVGVGIWSGWRLFGQGAPAQWFVTGLGAGALVAVLWL